MSLLILFFTFNRFEQEEKRLRGDNDKLKNMIEAGREEVLRLKLEKKKLDKQIRDRERESGRRSTLTLSHTVRL